LKAEDPVWLPASAGRATCQLSTDTRNDVASAFRRKIQCGVRLQPEGASLAHPL
jgi:hypothetical protein